MHSYYTRNNNPYQYGHYSIFVAEVASTVNEVLLSKHLLKTSKDKEAVFYGYERLCDKTLYIIDDKAVSDLFDYRGKHER